MKSLRSKFSLNLISRSEIVCLKYIRAKAIATDALGNTQVQMKNSI